MSALISGCVCNAIWGGSNFRNPKEGVALDGEVCPPKRRYLYSTHLWCCFIVLHKVKIPFVRAERTFVLVDVCCVPLRTLVSLRNLLLFYAWAGCSINFHVSLCIWNFLHILSPCPISHPESLDSLASGCSPGETLGYRNLIVHRVSPGNEPLLKSLSILGTRLLPFQLKMVPATYCCGNHAMD